MSFNNDALTDNKKSPRVTVLMPVYESAPYLREAIDSILGQTFSDFELLIMDNASTDDGPAIVASYQDPRIRYVRNEENLGLPASLNRGLKLAKGEFIARMDSDDRSVSDRLERQVSFLDKHSDIGICGGHIIKIMQGKRFLVKYPLSHEDIRVSLLFNSSLAHPTVMIRRSVLDEGRFSYSENIGNSEDYELWTRITAQVQSANLDRVLLEYRCHDSQLSTENYFLNMWMRNQIHRRMLQLLISGFRDDEVWLHGRISRPHESIELDALEKKEQWLERLIQANEQKGVFDMTSMRRIFAQRWVFICSQAAHLGLPVFRHYLQSSLVQGSVFSGSSAKLLVKCLLRKKYV